MTSPKTLKIAHKTVEINFEVILRVYTHENIKKLNKALDEPLTEENKGFVQDFIDKKYNGPLKQVPVPRQPVWWSLLFFCDSCSDCQKIGSSYSAASCHCFLIIIIKVLQAKYLQ